MPPLSDFVVSRGKNVWQKHGQDQFALGNYAEAAAAFTKALNLRQGDHVGILDNKAAALCAVGDLESALSDGRRMIKADKNDPRGYLRTAKILQLMRKTDEALRLYDYALERLDPQSEGYEANWINEIKQITTLRAKLDRGINGEKLTDPFTRLPPELIAEILVYLDLKTLLRVIRVSKLWKQFAISLAKGWSHLDLSIARRKVTTPAVRAYLRRSLKSLTRVTICNVKDEMVQKIVELLAHCPNLTRCEIEGQHVMRGHDMRPHDMRRHFPSINKLTKLTTLTLFDSIISGPQFVDILRRCPYLERVAARVGQPYQFDRDQLPALPNLRSLTMINSSARDALTMWPYFDDDHCASDKLPNLEELRLDGQENGDDIIVLSSLALSKLHRLRRCALAGVGFTDAPEFPKTLEHLYLFEVEIAGSQGPEEILGGMENLRSLSCTGRDFSVTRLLQGIPTDARPHLRCLELAGSYIEVSEFMELLRAGLLEHVTHLDLSRNFDIDGKLMATITDTMPNLEVLDLSMIYGITGLQFKPLADTDKLKLRLLCVSTELLANERDAVDYAQRRGLVITSREKAERLAPGSRFEDL